ncbi:lipocalin family protein [Parafrankia sp. EUN1f]|uniref:lipocalin family protein n=1 Tax=Parafrankia sp. EUN1f TaxID=102897 RepID=UPI0001C45E99|nr:lipocalin family protein [Parafrankia sp. EUN1f]EFC82289.1 secreted hydrolase-like protein [Parafrankia sp. EUN1f]
MKLTKLSPGRRQRRRLGLVLGALCTPLLLVLNSQSATAAMPAVVLPADEAAHPDSSMEWWYFTGHLQGFDTFGKYHEYGFEHTIIRSDARGTEPATADYNGQFAITDLTRKTFKQDIMTVATQADVVPAGGGYNNTVGLLHADGKNGVNHLTGSFSDNSYALDITLRQATPTALHGTAGVIPYGPWGESAYYSQTNLKALGTVTDHGVKVYITGIGWQDHQWGDFNNGIGNWDWFSIQLTNNTQYMLYFIKDMYGQVVQVVGTKVNANGSTTSLAPTAISETPQGSWTSPDTGAVYPAKWTVNVPGGTLTVTPRLAGQELFIPGIPQSSYWEGASTVTGTINGQSVAGRSYVELTPVHIMPTPFA